MHRCLAIPEMLDSILLSSGKSAAAKLARTCRMFQDRSLDFLWKDFDGGVVPLIWLLPQRLLHRENWKPYKRPGKLEDDEWDHLVRYTHRIKTFSWNGVTRREYITLRQTQISIGDFVEWQRPDRRGVLLPNVTAIKLLNLSNSDMCDCIPPLAPNASRYELHFHHSKYGEEYFSHFLSSVNWALAEVHHGHISIRDIPAEYSDITLAELVSINAGATLTSLYWDGIAPPTFWFDLASFPKLTMLHLQVYSPEDFPQHATAPMIPVPANSFTRLETLRLDGNAFDCIKTLEVLSPSLHVKKLALHLEGDYHSELTDPLFPCIRSSCRSGFLASLEIIATDFRRSLDCMELGTQQMQHLFDLPITTLTLRFGTGVKLISDAGLIELVTSLPALTTLDICSRPSEHHLLNMNTVLEVLTLCPKLTSVNLMFDSCSAIAIWNRHPKEGFPHLNLIKFGISEELHPATATGVEVMELAAVLDEIAPRLQTIFCSSWTRVPEEDPESSSAMRCLDIARRVRTLKRL